MLMNCQLTVPERLLYSYIQGSVGKGGREGGRVVS